MNNFRYEWKPLHAFHKIDIFRCEGGMQKEDIGKSVLIYGKRYFLGWGDIEQRKIKPIALAIVELL